MDEWQTTPPQPWSDDDASWPDDATPPTPPDEPLPPRTPPPPREPRFSRGSSSREIDSIGVEDTLAQTLHSPVPPGQQAARGRDAVVDKSTGAERSRHQDRRGTRPAVAPPPPRTTLPPRGKSSGKSNGKKSAGRQPGKAPVPARPSIAAPRENTPKRDKPRRPRRTAADVEAALNLGEFDGDTPREGAVCRSPTASPRRLGDAFDFRGLGPDGDDAAVAATLPLSARDVGATLRGAPVRAIPAPLLTARLTALDVSDCAHLKCSALAVLSRAAATLASLNCANAGLEALPDAWAALGRLETLDASRNRLHRWPANVLVHASAATALAQNLRRLDLAQNDIVDAPPSVALLARLAHLDLRDNRLRTVDAAVFSGTRVLDLSSNPDLVDLPPACASFEGQLIVRNNAQLTTPSQRVLEALAAPAFFRALSAADRALDRSRRRAYLARRDAALLERLQAVERRAARRGGFPLPPGPPDAARLANLLLTLQQQLDVPPPPPPPPRSSSMRSLSAAAAAAARRQAGGGLRRVASDAAVAEHTMAPTARSDLETARHALRRLGAGDDDADIEVLACFCLPESVVVKKRTVPLPPSAQLDLMREVAALVAAVPPREREIVPAARWPQDVLRALGSGERRLSPRIFHVSSHGVRKDAWWHASTSGTLLFHRRDGGAALPKREEVVDVLRQCGDGLELLFLNACASVDLAQYVAAKLPGLKVVCWRGRVHDACARFFARAFYAHVGERPGGDVAVAFSAAFARLRQEYVVGDPDPWPRPVACLGPAKRPQGLPVLVVV